MILIEGKKEEVIKRLKLKFEYDGSFIDRVMNTDPTGYKYVDYIAKQLEKLIPELAGEKGGLNVRQQDAIEDRMSSIIPWFHNNFNRITEDDIWEAEPIYRNQNGMVPNIENIAKSPKDINQYENPEFITTLMNVVDSKKSEREKERELKSQADKLYEDDDVLVVRPKSFLASCYYGANTKWCTASKGSSNYFDKYTKTGELYYFIKKKENKKFALYRNPQERQTEIYNAEDRTIGLNELREEFPNQNDLIDDLMGSGVLIKNLRKFSRGLIDFHEMVNSDESILTVKVAEPLGQSRVIIDFGDDDKFFKLLDIGEDDQWFLNSVSSYYNSYEFLDIYTIEEDFKYGYIVYRDLNDENVNKLKDIAEVVLSGEEFDLEDEEYRVRLSETLSSLFEDEVNNILEGYQEEKNREMLTTAQESIEKEFNDFLESIGFSSVRSYDRIETTVANLLMWSARLQLPKTDMISLFKNILEENGTGYLGGWAENSYEFQDDNNFDSVSFNNRVEIRLDEILEELDSDTEDITNSLGEFLEFRNRIVSKFKPNKWYELPKNKKINFRIEKFDRDNNKIGVRIQHPSEGYRSIWLSEENFNNLLYQPELFKFGEVY